MQHHTRKMAKDQQDLFMKGLNYISAAISPAMYYLARSLFIKYWKDKEESGVIGVNTALEGFEYWCTTRLENWYVGAALYIAITNNGTEAICKVIKTDVTK